MVLPRINCYTIYIYTNATVIRCGDNSRVDAYILPFSRTKKQCAQFPPFSLQLLIIFFKKKEKNEISFTLVRNFVYINNDKLYYIYTQSKGQIYIYTIFSAHTQEEICLTSSCGILFILFFYKQINNIYIYKYAFKGYHHPRDCAFYIPRRGEIKGHLAYFSRKGPYRDWPGSFITLYIHSLKCTLIWFILYIIYINRYNTHCRGK